MGSSPAEDYPRQRQCCPLHCIHHSDLWSGLNKLAELLERYSEIVGGGRAEGFGVFARSDFQPASSKIAQSQQMTKRRRSNVRPGKGRRTGKPLWNLSDLTTGEDDLSELLISFQG